MRFPNLHVNRLPGRAVRFAVLPAAALAFTAGGYAVASTSNSNVIHGCVDNGTHVLHVQSRCGRGQGRIVWNAQGPQGPAAASAFAEAMPGGSVTVQHNSTLQDVGGGNPGFYLFSAYLPPFPNEQQKCVVSATPVTTVGSFATTIPNADTVTVAQSLNTAGAFEGWFVQVSNASGHPVNDGVSVALVC